jgi:uncharacterized protein YjbI with pentapeptide repeats
VGLRYGGRKAIRANLAGANLHSANLRLAQLRGVNLRGADLAGASLSRAWLMSADLTGANLAAADLTNVGLGAYFQWRPPARLGGANFTGARYNRYTRWPPGFDPHKHGARQVESGD